MKEKLVRDNPGMRMRAEGIAVREATVAEMPMLLAHKLVEEAQEVLAEIRALQEAAFPEQTAGRAIREMADVFEVLAALRAALDVTIFDIVNHGDAKTAREGNFNMRLVAPAPE